MLLLSKRPQISLSAETWSYSLDNALRAAGQRILWRRALRVSALTLPAVVLGMAAYIFLTRLSAIDLPGWPVLLAFTGWLGCVWLWSRTQRVSSAEAARFLDRMLDLDERVSTYVQLVNSTRLVGGGAASNRVHRALAADAAATLVERLHLLPGRLVYRWTRGNVLAVVVALGALSAAVTFPTHIEVARSEQSALARALKEQLAQVQALRSDLEANQQISPALKASILDELDELARTLESSPLDQASGIATLADAEQRLRSLLRTPSADFDGLVAAAQLVWNSAAQNFEWDPEQSISTTDLGRASEASLFMSDNTEGMNPDAQRRVAFGLERASDQASGRDPELSSSLAEASTGLRTRDLAPASRALAQAAQKFAEANRQREDAVALESVLSHLNKGREQIAQAGRPQTRRAQVGFRRRGPSPGATTPTPDLEDFGVVAGDGRPGSAGSQDISNTSGMGPVVGQSNVAAYNGSPASGGSGGQPAQVAGQDGQTSPGEGPGGGTGGQDGGQAGGSNQTAGGGSAGGASADSGEQGTLSGSISGPVGGAAGAISRVPSPAGRGNSAGSNTPQGAPEDGTSGGAGEQVYVPGPGSNGEYGSPDARETDSDPAGDASSDGVGGRVGEGAGAGEEASSRLGPGGAVRVQTPYREVLAAYAREATGAIERAYVPPDAKQYVKDYFSELGK